MMYKNPATTAVPAPLLVSNAPWPGDTRLIMHVQPGAPLGFADVRLGMGRGTKGKGQRPGDDPALIVATLLRLAAHLAQYALDYESACLQDTQELVLCPCGEPATTAEHMRHLHRVLAPWGPKCSREHFGPRGPFWPHPPPL